MINVIDFFLNKINIEPIEFIVLGIKYLTIFITVSILMNQLSKINKKRQKLIKKYKKLVEHAYNFRETDSALSDTYAYDAMKLLNELNRLKYFTQGFTNSLS